MKVTPSEFLKAFPVPVSKKGWPDDLEWVMRSYDSMEEWWAECASPRSMLLVLKTMRYCEDIWKWPITKYGLECRDFSKRQIAAEKCCDRIRRKVVVDWACATERAGE